MRGGGKEEGMKNRNGQCLLPTMPASQNAPSATPEAIDLCAVERSSP